MICRAARSGELAQCLVHAVGGVPSHAGYLVRVAIKSHGDAGAPQKVLDQCLVNAATQKQCSARVPKIVPTNGGKSARLRSGLKWRLTMFWESTGVPPVCGENEVRVCVGAYPELLLVVNR